MVQDEASGGIRQTKAGRIMRIYAGLYRLRACHQAVLENLRRSENLAGAPIITQFIGSSAI